MGFDGGILSDDRYKRDRADGDGMAVITFLLGLGAGAGLSGLVAILVHLSCRNRDLEQRVTRLEETSRKRMPYAAADELLDAMAALDKLTMDVDVLNAIKENARGHIANALRVGTKEQK